LPIRRGILRDGTRKKEPTMAAKKKTKAKAKKRTAKKKQ
jgi:hypothetical protein